MAPIIHQLNGLADVVTCFTGQHQQMVKPLLGFFHIGVDIDANVMVAGQSLNSLTRRTLERLEVIVARVRPTWVVVQGMSELYPLRV